MEKSNFRGIEMGYSVSSWFVDQCADSAPTIRRIFTISGSDYSDKVLGWPTISSQWDNFQPNNITINLANEDQTFNFFKTAKTNLQAACAIKFGFTHPQSGDELLSIFNGSVSEATFRDGQISLRITDKIQQLSDRLVGGANSAAVFSSTTMLPSDIAWTACTCYGGFSSVKSTSNPDIDYAAFQSWAAVFSSDTVLMHGRLTGAKVVDVLRRISQQTQSAAYVANDKLVFARWSTINTEQIINLSNDNILSLGVSIRSDTVINKQVIEFAYNVTSRSWGSSVVAANTASVNSFGPRENLLRDDAVWYVSSANALNMAQRSLFVSANPFDDVSVSTTLVPLHKTVGDMLSANDQHLDISEGWRIMGMKIDLNSGLINININGSQINTPFTLDVTSLDGTEALL